jgi:hypothetical protein
MSGKTYSSKGFGRTSGMKNVYGKVYHFIEAAKKELTK